MTIETATGLTSQHGHQGPPASGREGGLARGGGMSPAGGTSPASREQGPAEGGPLRDSDPVAEAIDAGDHRRALALCARHHGTVLGRFCHSLTGTQAEADDIVQETLLDAHRGFGTWKGTGSIRSWLFSIARRKCARAIERRSRQQNRLHLIHDAEQPPVPDELAVIQQHARQARALMEQIRPSEREALQLRFSGGLSFREVGEACGVDEAAARKRVSRAIARLRDLMGAEE
jgi:RNA polymerase sigma-70 factor, ECF subfamily